MKSKWLFLFSLFVAFGSFATDGSEDSRLAALINLYTQESGQLDPFLAPSLQVQGYDAELGDFPSANFFSKKLNLLHKMKARIATIDVKKLSRESELDYLVLSETNQNAIASAAHEGHHYMNFSHMENRFVGFMNQADPDEGLFPFLSLKNYQDFAKRMQQFPAYVERMIDVEREGIAKGYRQSCYSVRGLAVFLEPALVQNLEENPFWKPILALPENISQSEGQSLKELYRNLIQHEIQDAYTSLIHFVNSEYSQSCLEKSGLSALPNGAVLYKDLLKSEADTDLAPEVIHQMGLREVERIQEQFLKVQKEMGFIGTLKEFLDFMRNDPKNYFDTKEELVARFEELKNKTMPLLPQYFNVAPKTPFTIETKDQPGSAYARFPTKLNPQGAIVLETASLQTFPKFTTATLYLHEGMPGHVFSGSVQFENENLSEFRRTQFYSNAFDEGWALYAESLGYNMGLFQEPYSHFGHLADDMLRAVRLVVDTGLHGLGWTRDQAVQYMDHLVPYQLSATETEIDRYLGIPAQAVSYKIGQFKILELRERARKKLGQKFSLKEFNSEIVKDGIMSLPVLEKKMNAWMN